MNMSISDALLIESEWWFLFDENQNNDAAELPKVFDFVFDVLTEYEFEKTQDTAESFFCLLVREAIKDE